jgi:hypothetical protein
MKSTDPIRAVNLEHNGDQEWAKARYPTKKGRAVLKSERPTYDQAHAAMLAKQIQSWHLHEDGWTFTTNNVETTAMSLADAKLFLDQVKLPTPAVVVEVPVDSLTRMVADRFSSLAA